MLSCVMWPEARAGSPSAEAPRGRRLQRRGRRRIMRQRSWPGRVDPDPLGSVRLGPARQVCGRQRTSRSGSPTRSWNSQANDPGTGPGGVKTLRLRPSGRDARAFREEAREEVTVISSKTELPTTRQFLEKRHQSLRQDF